MRYIIYTAVAGQTLFLIWAIAQTVFHPSDKAGQGMAYGFLTIGALIMAIFLIPALILSRSHKWGWLGLVLALIPPAFAIWLNMV